MSINGDAYDGFCEDPNGDNLKNFDLLDDCRVVGLYTATTTEEVASSGATSYDYNSEEGVSCFELEQTGDHTDEWSNYTGSSVNVFISSEECGSEEITITDVSYNIETELTSICYEGVNECFIEENTFTVTVTSGVTEEKQTDLNQTCCTDVFNFYWDEENNECKWCSKEDCEPGDLFKVILGSDENSGAFFEEENDEDCYLEIEFDYLFKYKCNELYNCVTGSTANTIDSIFSLDVDVNLEKNVTDKTGFTGNYVTEYTEDLYDVSNVVSYLDGNHDTGILLEGDNCERVIENAKDDLGIYCGVINEDTFYSGWLHHKIAITNEAILSAITDEDIHVSFTINDWKCNFYVLADNIEINKKCEKEKKVTTTITSCPGFDLERVEDNKKSWIANEKETNRHFDFKDRFTNYEVDYHDLVINSKEIDLRFGIPYAVETKVKQYIEDNPCLLEGDLTDIDCCCYCPVGYDTTVDNEFCIKTDSFSAVTCDDTNLIVNSTFDNSLSGWTTTNGSVAHFNDNNWQWSSYTGGSAEYIGGNTDGILSQDALQTDTLYRIRFDACVEQATTTDVEEQGYNFSYTAETQTGCFIHDTSDYQSDDTTNIWEKAIGESFEIECGGEAGNVIIDSTEFLSASSVTVVCVRGDLNQDLVDCLEGSSNDDYRFDILGNTTEPYKIPFEDGDHLDVFLGDAQRVYPLLEFANGCKTKTFLDNSGSETYLSFYAALQNDHLIYVDNVYVTDCVEYEVTPTTTDYAYGARGVYFYESINNKDYPLIDAQLDSSLDFSRGFEDQSGETVTATTNVQNTFWGQEENSTTNGRLNNIGVWTQFQGGNLDKPLNEWIGFLYCVDIPETTNYLIGIGADDDFRFFINGEKILEIQNNWGDDTHSHKGWHVLPIELETGLNVIRAEGRNTSEVAAVGVEIYSADSSVISGVTSESELSGYTVFSTGDRVGTIYDVSDNVEECPEGYTLENCDGELKCTKIDRFPCVNDKNCVEGCGDQDIDILSKIDNPVDSFVTIDDFRDELYQNLIDPRSRQTLNNYPLLRAVYDRYLNAEDHCGSGSSSFDYFQMENFSKLVGDYWIDIIEQFIPSTAIWGSTFLYGNTVFDNNKFDYRRYSLLTCCDDELPATGKTCPSGYTLSPEGDRCVKKDTVSATTADTIYNIAAGSDDGSYGQNGTHFYEDITNLPKPLEDTSNDQIIDASGNTVELVVDGDSIWRKILQDVGVWTEDQDSTWDPTNEWIGFSYCLDIPEGGVYSIGMAADNKCRFRINGEPIVNLNEGSTFDFYQWFVFPYTFDSGLNIIEMEGLNSSGFASFGAQIYSADTETLTGLTQSELSAYTIFNTRDLVGGIFELGENSGLSCPDGYALNTCSGTPVCTKIEETDPEIVQTGTTTGACKTTNVTPLPKVGSKYVDVTQRDLSEILEPDQLAPHTTGKTYMNSYDPLISYTADTTASTITNINIEDNLLNEFYVSGLTNNDIENFLLTATTSASTTVGPYFRRNDNFDYIFTGITSFLDVIDTTSGSTTATTIGTVSGTTTYYSGLTFNAPDCIEVERPGVNCPYVYTVNMDVGSEFIGSVTKIPKQKE